MNEGRGARLVGSNVRSRANALKGIPLSEAGETTNKGSGRRPQPLGFKDVPPPPPEAASAGSSPGHQACATSVARQ